MKTGWYARRSHVELSGSGIRVDIRKPKSIILTGRRFPLFRLFPPSDEDALVPEANRHFLCSFTIEPSIDCPTRVTVYLCEYGPRGFFRKTVIGHLRLGQERANFLFYGTLAARTRSIRLGFYSHDEYGTYTIADFRFHKFQVA